ncbi:MAG: metal ABC transporter ATP-binding protein [Dehalococcoidia bacterium]|nr:metal ABC transporter ATP-binding protein [Dehalococcoidia bacterium]
MSIARNRLNPSRTTKASLPGSVHTPAEVVTLSHVSVDYEGIPALDDVSLTIYENDFVGIIGPNGGGKSTLLKVILGLVTPRKGEVQLWGQPLQKATQRIGYVPQHTSFDRDFPITVWNVVLMGRLSHRHMLHSYNASDKAKAMEALETVGIAELRKRPIGSLSGGQQQRAFIARALVHDTALLLLDEPMANVDSNAQDEFYSLLSRLRRQMAIMMVSHDLTAISVNVDKVACLNKTLYYHGSKEIPPSDIEAAYGCPVELLAHGMPHRVLRKHD